MKSLSPNNLNLFESFLIKFYQFSFLGLVPSFTLIEERSTDERPLVKVNFADGSSDYLILSKYEGMDGRFIGHLRNEPRACVAMVNHPEHTELTIMSERAIGEIYF